MMYRSHPRSLSRALMFVAACTVGAVLWGVVIAAIILVW